MCGTKASEFFPVKLLSCQQAFYFQESGSILLVNSPPQSFQKKAFMSRLAAFYTNVLRCRTAKLFFNRIIGVWSGPSCLHYGCKRLQLLWSQDLRILPEFCEKGSYFFY